MTKYTTAPVSGTATGDDGSTATFGIPAFTFTNSTAPAPAPTPATVMAVPVGYTAVQMVRDDAFASFDSSFWINGMASPNGSLWGVSGLQPPYSGIGSAGQYNAEYDDPAQVGFATNGLTITAMPSNKFPGYYWKSGALTSRQTFPPTGRTVYIQWSAQMPDVTFGAWPGFWLLFNNGSGGEMDVYEGGFLYGVLPPNRTMTTTLHAPGNKSSVQHQLPQSFDLNAGMHVYGVEIADGGHCATYLDGIVQANWVTSLPVGGGNIIIDLSMGQNRGNWGTNADAASHPGPYLMRVPRMQIFIK